MRCSACQHENVHGARFCGRCGELLGATVSCRACDSENPRSNVFCSECGRALAAHPGEEPERPGPEAERRQLTVMFCDLVDSTGLARQLGPEGLREAVRAYQETCGEVIRRFEGHLAQYLGDGLLVYFGYPQAHEDDAVRAVSAALEMLAELPGLNARVGEGIRGAREHPLQIRIAVHTGPVVVGEMGSGDKREELALGDTLSIASRLQGVAHSDEVVISAATRRLIRGVFVTESLGPGSLKGIPDPVPIFRVLRETGIHSRLELEAETGLTPFVGREEELGLLLDRWEQAKEGRGQAVLLSGEPGIGKSRLMQVLRDQLAEQPNTWFEGRCSPYHRNSAFYPVIELLRQGLLLRSDDSAEASIEKLERLLRPAGLPLSETVPLFAALLSVPLPAPRAQQPARYSTLSLNREALRRKTLEALVAWLLATAERQPVVLVMEDLHWMDPSTLELLGMILDQVPTAPVLVLLTFREGFEPPWASRSHRMHLTLHSLTRKQIETMVEGITEGKGLPSLVREQLVAKTDGVPLFVEELTKSVLESNLLRESDRRYERADPLPQLAIPSTLQDSLMARLDRLGPAKEVAQLGSVLGREFSHELLSAVSVMEDASIADAIGELSRAELLHQRGLPPRATYTFKHALIQDIAYQSLLESKRQEYHRQVAQTLTERMPRVAEAQPEVVAHHFAEAGETEQAVDWWSRAGGKALTTAAASEAERFYERGVRAIGQLPDSPDRAARELELQIGLGSAMNASRGWGNPDVRSVWERGHALASAIDSRAALAVTDFGLSTHLAVHGQLAEVIAFADRALSIAEEIGDDDLLLDGLSAAMLPRVFAGALDEVVSLGNRALPLLQGDQRPRNDMGLWIHSEVAVPDYLAMANVVIGNLDEAVRWGEKAIEQARLGGDPNTLAGALVLGGVTIRIHRREWSEVHRLGEEPLELADRYELPMWSGVVRVLGEAVRAIDTGDPAAVTAAKEGLAMAGATGMQLGAPIMLRLIAEAENRLGRLDAALEAVAGALSMAGATGQHFEDAYLYAVRGEALSKRDPVAAEAAFQQGLEVARQQSAKTPELRVATELARLWRDQGRVNEARSLLAPVCEWFSEGLDTPLLQNAKALLDELT